MKKLAIILMLCWSMIGWGQYQVPVPEQMNMHVLFLNYPTTFRLEADGVKELFTVKCIKIRKSDRYDTAFKPKGKYLQKEIQLQAVSGSNGSVNLQGAGFRLTLDGAYFKRKDYLRVEFWQKDSLFGHRDYELRKLPLPMLYWNGLKSGLFQKERGALELTLGYGETSILREMQFSIDEWEIISDGAESGVKGTGNKLSAQATQFLKALPPKTTVYIRGKFSGSGFDHAPFEGKYQL